MKFKIYISIKNLALIFFSISLHITAQQINAPWNDYSQQNRGIITLQETVTKAEDYFKTIDTNKKGSGYKPFRRWQEHWSHFLTDNGSIMSKEALLEAWKTKTSRNNNTNTSNWVPLGPYENSNRYSANAPEYKQSGQGRINTILVDPNNSSIIYIGAPAGGLWKSTNGGINWTPLTDHLPQIGVSGIAIDSSDSNTIYIATGDDDANDTTSIGIWKSTDGGNTWNQAGNLNGNPTSTNEIYINPNQSQTVLVATNQGVQKSTNGGNSWTTVLNENIGDLKMKPGDSNTWYAVSDNRFFKSVDGGNTFQVKAVHNNLNSSSRLMMDVTIANPNYVYIVSAGSSSSNFNGIYKSTNSGESFSKTQENNDIFGSTQAWYDLAITASSVNPEIVYVGVLDIWKSTNGGNNFTKINEWFNPNQNSYTHADIHFLRFFNNKLYAGTDGGIYVSDDEGLNFIDFTKNLAISQFYKIAVSQKTDNTVVGGLQDNGGFTLSNNQWLNYHGGDGMEAAINPLNDNILYGFMQRGQNLFISNDGGLSLSAAVGSPNGVNGRWVTPLSVNTVGEVYSGFNNIYLLTNSGWERKSITTFDSSIKLVETNPRNTNIIAAATNTSVYISNDKGVTFSKKQLTSNFNPIEGITFSKTEDAVYIITRNDLYKSSDFLNNNNPSFQNLNKSLPSEGGRSIKHVGRSANNTLYLATNLGVYYTDDTLSDWELFDTNLPNVPVADMGLNEEAGKLFVATYGRGVFYSNIPTTIPSQDISVTEINQGVTDNYFCGDASISINIKNVGSNPITSVDFTLKKETTIIDNFNWSGNLASNASIEIPRDINNGLSEGTNHINITAVVDGDVLIQNNSLQTNIVILNSKTEDVNTVHTFEDTNHDLFTEGINWLRGVINKNQLQTSSGTSAYATQLSGNYLDNGLSYLYLGCYDLTRIDNPVLKFNMGFDIENNWDYLLVEYATDNSNWQILGSSNDPNWYNSSSTQNGLPGKQWTGENNTAMLAYSYDLSSLNNEAEVRFRFKFLSDAAVNREGAIIDDFLIEGILNSLSTEKELLEKNTSIFPNPSTAIFNINSKNNSKLNLSVYNILGREVFTKADITKNYSLNLSNYPKGVYLLKLNSENSYITKKLILR